MDSSPLTEEEKNKPHGYRYTPWSKINKTHKVPFGVSIYRSNSSLLPIQN